MARKDHRAMTMSLTHLIEAQAALYDALRGALPSLNEEIAAHGYRLVEWPMARPGHLICLSITLEHGAERREIGEARFMIDARGAMHFEADEATPTPCAATREACTDALGAFIRAHSGADRAQQAA